MAKKKAMPSIRKRIGYLPSPYVKELITQISNTEKISQSKIVGILVEEALMGRGLLRPTKSSYTNINELNNYEINNDNSHSKYNEMDELISDKGISYNKKPYKNYQNYSTNNSFESRDEFNGKLFEQFKQFIQFQKTIQEK